jgi:hypothetical protein
MPSMILQYCRRCDKDHEEDVARCDECGYKLEARRFDLVGHEIPTGIADAVGRQLDAADIPFRLRLGMEVGEGQARFLDLLVESAAVRAAIPILHTAGVAPAQPEDSPPALFRLGGCGSHVAPGQKECPECHLSFGTG